MLGSSLSKLALLSAVLTMPVLAQDSSSCNCTLEPRKPSGLELRSSGIVSFAQSRPTGAFARNIGFGYGAIGTYLVRLDDAGVFSLRADGGLLGYGYEYFYAPLSTTIGGRIQVKVSTTNYVLPLSLGPQIAWPRGTFRPYANVGIATQILYTQTGAEGADDSGDYPSTTNQSDWTGAWVLGGGVYMPVYELNTKVAIDVGVQYFTGGHAQYLRPGSIEDLPNAQIRITPLESDTHMMLIRIGVKIGL